MPADFFLDTNVLIYAADTTGKEPAKTATALALAKHAAATISTQVLGEFYHATTTAKRKPAFSHQQALNWIVFWRTCDVRPVTLATVDSALALASRYGIGYYDSLILAAASEAGCSTVYTEDLNDGQAYGSVTVHNPFAAGFLLP